MMPSTEKALSVPSLARLIGANYHDFGYGAYCSEHASTAFDCAYRVCDSEPPIAKCRFIPAVAIRHCTCLFRNREANP